MKRISIVAIAAVTFACWTSSARAIGFEPLGVDGILRSAGVGFGQGYHSYPKNPALRHAFGQAHCNRFAVVPPPAYPCSPRAPEMHRNCGCNGGGFGQNQMIQYAAPATGSTEMHSPVDQPATSPASARTTAAPPSTAQDPWSMNNDESTNDWNEIPETNKRPAPANKRPTPNPAEDSPRRESLPTPKDSLEPKPEVDAAGEDLLDELESYFGEDVGPAPREPDWQLRRLPPVSQDDTSPAATEVFTTQPSGEGVRKPGAPPVTKDSDVWW